MVDWTVRVLGVCIIILVSRYGLARPRRGWVLTVELPRSPGQLPPTEWLAALRMARSPWFWTPKAVCVEVRIRGDETCLTVVIPEGLEKDDVVNRLRRRGCEVEVDPIAPDGTGERNVKARRYHLGRPSSATLRSDMPGKGLGDAIEAARASTKNRSVEAVIQVLIRPTIGLRSMWIRKGGDQPPPLERLQTQEGQKEKARRPAFYDVSILAIAEAIDWDGIEYMRHVVRQVDDAIRTASTCGSVRLTGIPLIYPPRTIEARRARWGVVMSEGEAVLWLPLSGGSENRPTELTPTEDVPSCEISASERSSLLGDSAEIPQ